MEQQELELVEGTVSVVIYQNEDNGYTILKLDVRDEEVTVVGTMPGVAPGEYLSVRGRWTRHPTYGVQLKAQVVERRLPQGLKEIFHYLSSGAVKGIGKATARLVIEEFGEEALTVIEDDPDQLTKIRGISPKRARQIGEAFRQQMGTRRLVEFLTEHQLPLEPVSYTHLDVYKRQPVRTAAYPLRSSPPGCSPSTIPLGPVPPVWAWAPK